MALRGANRPRLDSGPAAGSDGSGRDRLTSPLLDADGSDRVGTLPHPTTSTLGRTFLHLPRIGLRTEQKLWRQGIMTWDDLEAARNEPSDLFGRRSPLLEAIDASRKALEEGDTAFFAERLPPRDHYRIATCFPTQTVFLDIETTGLSLYYDTITLVGCASGKRYACHVMGTGDAGNNAAVDLIEGAKCLVTFNGTLFDLKFLAKYVPGLRLPAAHVDLRYLVRRVSLTGGQKEVEKTLGVERADGVEDIDGAQAVLLWYEYVSGNVEAGRRLVRYNHADVEGMKPILDHAIVRMAEAGAQSVTALTGRFSSTRSELCFEEPPHGVHVPRFAQPTRSAMTLERLTASLPSGLCVVGIDLTGSGERPSGWCELRGALARTRMIGHDDDIMAAIEQAGPDLVSIDSPLSLPTGRLRVEDDDPGRDEFGIMRTCERMLKRRGVNVYPCLIPSMQRLTARGIRLASAMRERGIPVIESYPGAAQDIMNIPRKGAGLAHLKKGLELFGVTGDYVQHKVTHDELDAITAAIVGLYFWAGRYEGLGTVEEDYLIVPDLERVVRPRRIIGISGPIAAGKTTAARLLETVGFRYGRYSEVLSELASEQGRPANRDTLQQLGQAVHLDPGQRWLNSRLLCRLNEDNDDLVIDGLRWPEDRAFWVERFGPMFRHVHVSAPSNVRRERYPNDGGSVAEFDAASAHEVERGVRNLGALADLVLENDQDLDAMRRLLGERIDARLLEEGR